MYFVFSKPVEGREDEFNEWYDRVHVPDLLAIAGVVSAQRFDLLDAEIVRAAGWTPEQRYLAIYEIDEDPDTVMARVREAVETGKMVISDALDAMEARMSFWSPRGPKIEA
jgi:hypothetical protein